MFAKRGIVLGLAVPALLVAWWGSKSYLQRREPHPDSHEVAADAGAALEEMKPAERAGAIRKGLEHSDAWMRRTSVDALPRNAMAGSWEAIEKALQDNASVVRIRAFEVAADVDPMKGVRALAAGLQDEDTWVRHAAISQISTRVGRKGSVITKDLVPTLVGVLGQDDRFLVTMAIGALRKLTGQGIRIPRGADEKRFLAAVAQWRDWYKRNSAEFPTPEHLKGVIPYRTERSEPAPDFAIRDIDGRGISLSEFKGKPVLINFWGSWCPPCLEEIPALIHVEKELGPRGLEIVGAASAETEGPAEFRKTCEKLGICYLVAFATDSMMRDYGNIHELPVSIMVDRKGRIRYKWEGDRDISTFMAAANRLLSEQ